MANWEILVVIVVLTIGLLSLLSLPMAVRAAVGELLSDREDTNE